MKTVRVVLIGAALLGLGVAACSAAAQLNVVRPPPLPSSPPYAAVSPAKLAARKPAMQLGVDVDLYTYPRQNFHTAASADVAYIKRLHANSVSVSFPFFMHGALASGVYASSATPSPAQLAVFARVATAAGFYVSIRPLLDEASLGESRVSWKPHNPGAWFSSYQRFLLPYAVMAQRTRIPEFIVGAEFSGFSSSYRWNHLDKTLRRVFKGTLAYANNGMKLRPHSGGKYVRITFDAYPSLPFLPTDATVKAVTQAWRAYDARLPRRAVLTEVGIAAVSGAYSRPWVHHWATRSIDPTVQERWFTAACDAAEAQHIGGLYFWPIGFGKLALSSEPSIANQGLWSTISTKAISACFGRVRHG